jgi:Protein of unknown function (DUF4232)
MRFKVVPDSRPRPPACHRLARAPLGNRAAVGALAAACGLMLTACGSQSAAGTAASATPAVSATATPGPPTPADASIEACVTSQLKVSLSNTGALGGQAGGYLKFTNGSRTPCRMSGWPIVSGLTAAGTATLLRHAQSTMFGAWHYTAPPPVVTLQPGDSAYAVVAAGDQPAGNNAHCPAPYVRLRVSPPGDSGHVTVSAWLPGAGSYLPACTSVDGSPTAETSTITTLARLPH